jgi:hypothetical protein
MKTLMKWIKSLLPETSYGSQMERYIVGCNPTNIADVENLAANFERRVQKGIL